MKIHNKDNLLHILNNEVKSNPLNLAVKISNNDINISLPKNFNNSIEFHLETTKNTASNVEFNIEDNVSCKLEELLYSKNNSLAYNVTYNLKNNSNVTVNSLNILSTKETSITRKSSINRDSTLNLNICQLQSTSFVEDTNVDLVNVNATCNYSSITLTSETQTSKFDVRINHNAKHTNSNIENYAVANGSSKLDVSGIGYISQGNSNSNAFQTTKVLLLSDKAQASANPYLLIDEYDVAAGHGATLGSINDEDLYYLMSRGINLIDAQRLIIEGYINPSLNKLNETFLELTTDIVKNKLG